jgi:DNA-binding NarL/FixJ family response regulator
MSTIMLVEDHISYRKMVRDDILSRFPSIRVIEASNGEEAVKGLASYPADLIFMDLSLPDQNGMLLTKAIKADNPNAAVVILSSYDFDAYRKAALQSGANGYIGKDSMNVAQQISTVITCFHGAEEAGRLNPACLLLS